MGAWGGRERFDGDEVAVPEGGGGHIYRALQSNADAGKKRRALAESKAGALDSGEDEDRRNRSTAYLFCSYLQLCLPPPRSCAAGCGYVATDAGAKFGLKAGRQLRARRTWAKRARLGRMAGAASNAQVRRSRRRPALVFGGCSGSLPADSTHPSSHHRNGCTGASLKNMGNGHGGYGTAGSQ